MVVEPRYNERHEWHYVNVTREIFCHATVPQPVHADPERDFRGCRAPENRSPARSFSSPRLMQKNAKQESRASDVMSLSYCESMRGSGRVGAPRGRVERTP
ncbi:hypothetical protein GCM10027288_04300 [Bordetella tumbae]